MPKSNVHEMAEETKDAGAGLGFDDDMFKNGPKRKNTEAGKGKASSGHLGDDVGTKKSEGDGQSERKSNAMSNSMVEKYSDY